MIPEIVYPLYHGKKPLGASPLFLLFFRCVLTRISQGEEPKPILRNLIFNFIRQFGLNILVIMFLDGKGYRNVVDMGLDLKYQIVLVPIFTFLMQNVSKQAFRNYRYFYIYLETEYKFILALGAINLMNKVHSNGDMVTGFIMILIAMNARQGWIYLEDMWYQDLNSVNWKVWPVFYLPWIFGVIANYTM